MSAAHLARVGEIHAVGARAEEFVQAKRGPGVTRLGRNRGDQCNDHPNDQQHGEPRQELGRALQAALTAVPRGTAGFSQETLRRPDTVDPARARVFHG